MSKGIFEERDAGGRPLKANAEASFFVGILLELGVMFGDFLLRVFQNVDAETALGLEKRQQTGVLVYANKNQQGIEGNGGERIRGHAVNLTRFSFDGEDGNSGGETAHDTAE